MNLSRVPPNSSISRLMRAWKGRRAALTSSGSARSERAVNPTRSQNSTVTTLRSSAGAVPSSRLPQPRQNLARSGFSSPQPGQTFTEGV
jgi:hypothetical protein